MNKFKHVTSKIIDVKDHTDITHCLISTITFDELKDLVYQWCDNNLNYINKHVANLPKGITIHQFTNDRTGHFDWTEDYNLMSLTTMLLMAKINQSILPIHVSANHLEELHVRLDNTWSLMNHSHPTRLHQMGINQYLGDIENQNHIHEVENVLSKYFIRQKKKTKKYALCTESTWTYQLNFENTPIIWQTVINNNLPNIMKNLFKLFETNDGRCLPQGYITWDLLIVPILKKLDDQQLKLTPELLMNEINKYNPNDYSKEIELMMFDDKVNKRYPKYDKEHLQSVGFKDWCYIFNTQIKPLL